MTQVAFHFNAPDKLHYAARLLRKASAQGAKVAVVGLPEDLQALDVQLWTLSPQDFIAHAAWPADPQVWAASPVLLCEVPNHSHHREVLLNLGHTVPQGYQEFARLIEVVTVDEAERQAARTRWKHYSDQGLTIVRHDVATQG
jgi:DNA polymerase-3 subunit chi